MVLYNVGSECDFICQNSIVSLKHVQSPHTCRVQLKLIVKFVAEHETYSQLSPCGHLTIADNLTIQTAAKSKEKINCRHFTEILKFPLLQSLAVKDINSRSQMVSAITGVDCIFFSSPFQIIIGLVTS